MGGVGEFRELGETRGSGNREVRQGWGTGMMMTCRRGDNETAGLCTYIHVYKWQRDCQQQHALR